MAEGNRATSASQARRRQARIARMAKTAEARFEQAEAAREAGNVWLASQLYLRVALTRPQNKHTAAAKEALAGFQEQGRQKLADVSGALTVDTCHESLALLDDLTAEYEFVPSAGREIAAQRNRVRRDFAAILNEPAAAELLAAASRHEAEGELCCAYLAYREAALLAPAPSGLAAEERFRTLNADPAVEAAALACRQLRRCHDKFLLAKRYVQADPQRSERLFREIVEAAPEESDVHQSARAELAMLGR